MVTFNQIRDYVEAKDWQALAEAYTEAKTFGFTPCLDAETAEKIRGLMLECALFGPDGSYGFPRVLLNALDDIGQQSNQLQTGIEVGIEPKKSSGRSIRFDHAETGQLTHGIKTPFDFLFLIAALHDTRQDHVYATNREGLAHAIDLCSDLVQWINDCCTTLGMLLVNSDLSSLTPDMCDVGWALVSLNRLACHVQTASANMQFALGKMQKKEAA